MYICINDGIKTISNNVEAPPVRRAVFFTQTNKRMKNEVVIDFEINKPQLADLEQRISQAKQEAPADLNFENRIQFILHLHDVGVFQTREEMLMCTALMYS